MSVWIARFNEFDFFLAYVIFFYNFALGEMAEWSIAAVLKTVEGHTSGGSNPSFSAIGD